MDTTTRNTSEYDWESELKAFEDSKAGVKGLVDAGITKLPLMFIHPPDNLEANSGISSLPEFRLPLIDLDGFNDHNPTLRPKIIDQVREASENFGFFLVVNHGIPDSVLEEMIDGIRRFHEQDAETKKEFYSHDYTERVSFFSHNNSFKTTAAWRDSLFWPQAPNLPDPKEFPAACRDIAIEYTKQVNKVGYTILELLSEALGLDGNHLKDLECAEKLIHAGHYHPPCPEPELTLGAGRHSDTAFFTVILQDQAGGLQVLYQNQYWIDVVPHPGALAIIFGLSLQVITNDKFKGLEHRVLVKRERSRVSVVSGFGPTFFPSSKLYSPIKELVTEKNPAKYKEATMEAHVAYLRGQKV